MSKYIEGVIIPVAKKYVEFKTKLSKMDLVEEKAVMEFASWLDDFLRGEKEGDGGTGASPVS